MGAANLTRPVPFELAEDETVTIPTVTWNKKTDELEGFRGELTEDSKAHRCSFDVTAFATSIDSINFAFSRFKIGNQLRSLTHLYLVCLPHLQQFFPHVISSPLNK